MTDLRQQLRELTALVGISSREDDVVKYMYSAFSRYSDNVDVDMLGNVTAAFPCGREGAQKLMFFAHMDEVGMVVKKVEPSGFLRVERLSAVNNHVLPGAAYSVRTHSGKLVPGVIGAKSHHFMTPDEKLRLPDFHQLYLDIGCKTAQEAESMGITTGCVVAFEHRFIEMGNNIVATKSIDDRAGLLALLGLAKHLQGRAYDFDIYIVASVQEEFNLRGIMPAARRIDPDIAVCIDVAPLADTPDTAAGCELSMGAGPALAYYTYHGRGTLNGLIPNEKLVHFFEEVCGKQGIKFQREVSRGCLTESSYIAISGEKGVACVNISVPTRYTHTPVEMASLDDISATIDMLTAFADNWNPQTDLRKHIWHELEDTTCHG